MSRIPAVDPTRERGRLTNALHSFGMSRAGRWYGIHVGSRIDPLLLKLTRGRFATTSFFPLVLLRVRGRKSGELRTVTLVYFTDGEEVILVASSFGRARHPAWFHNLMAAGEVEIEAGGVRAGYRPRLHGLRRKFRRVGRFKIKMVGTSRVELLTPTVSR